MDDMVTQLVELSGKSRAQCRQMLDLTEGNLEQAAELCLTLPDEDASQHEQPPQPAVAPPIPPRAATPPIDAFVDHFGIGGGLGASGGGGGSGGGYDFEDDNPFSMAPEYLSALHGHHSAFDAIATQRHLEDSFTGRRQSSPSPPPVDRFLDDESFGLDNEESQLQQALMASMNFDPPAAPKAPGASARVPASARPPIRHTTTGNSARSNPSSGIRNPTSSSSSSASVPRNPSSSANAPARNPSSSSSSANSHRNPASSSSATASTARNSSSATAARNPSSSSPSSSSKPQPKGSSLPREIPIATRPAAATAFPGAAAPPPAPVPRDDNAQRDGRLTLVVNYCDKEHRVRMARDSTMRDLKEELHRKTGVEPRYQELVGWPVEYGAADLSLLGRLVLKDSVEVPLFLLNTNESASGPGSRKESSASRQELSASRQESSATDMDVESESVGDPMSPRQNYSNASFYSDEEDEAVFGQDVISTPLPYKPLIAEDRTDPTAFAAAFEAEYGVRRPAFLALSFQETIAIAGESLRPVMLYLHDVRAVSTNIFCSKVLTHPEVVKIINANFISFGWDMSTDFGRNYLFNASRGCIKLSHEIAADYPEILFLVKTRSGVRVVGHLHGYQDVEQVMEALVAAADAADAHLAEERRVADESRRRTEMLEEQDRAYRESLEADRRKEQERVDGERRRAEEEARLKAEEEERTRKQKMEEETKEARIARIRASLPPEPADNAENSTLVQFRVPGGARLKRKFLLSDPLQIVLDFVESEGFPSSSHQLLRVRESLKDVVPSTTLKDAGFGPREAITVDCTD